MRKRVVSGHSRLIYRATTALLVVWMAIFAPATCLHHGFLLRALPALDAAGPSTDHDRMALMARAHEIGHTVDEVAPAAFPSFTPMLHHQTLGGETSIMVLLAIAMPVGLPLPSPRPTLVWLESREHLASISLPPPIRPPRSA